MYLKFKLWQLELINIFLVLSIVGALKELMELILYSNFEKIDFNDLVFRRKFCGMFQNYARIVQTFWIKKPD